MKVVKLSGGWYVEPQTSDEESHLSFSLERQNGGPDAGGKTVVWLDGKQVKIGRASDLLTQLRDRLS